MTRRSERNKSKPTAASQLSNDARQLHEFFTARSAEAMAVIKQFVYPLFGKSNSGKATVIGTCFVLAVGSERLLVSAAHVFRGVGDSLALIGVENGVARVIPPKGALIRSSISDAEGDPFDLAIVRLRPAVVEQFATLPAVTLAQLDMEPQLSDIGPDVGGDLTFYCVLGFPSAMNKLSVPRGKESAAVAGYWTAHGDRSDYVKAGMMHARI